MQWHQLDHMQTICTSLQTDNHTNTLSHNFYRLEALPDPPTNSVKALKAPQYTHTRLTAFFPGLPRWAGTRKVKPIWILLKQVTVSGSGISWAICKSAPRSRQTTMRESQHSAFYRPDALPAAQPTASKHWRHHKVNKNRSISNIGINDERHQQMCKYDTIPQVSWT